MNKKHEAYVVLKPTDTSLIVTGVVGVTGTSLVKTAVQVVLTTYEEAVVEATKKIVLDAAQKLAKLADEYQTL